ncbi:MAG: nucleotidyltransferase domain-containing protein [Bacteroidota bacterium]|nr:nucleotidyltransferase domain-containing protein [Bacteroidota bacterium]MDP3558374.1 nucleotidyltransferase domain-containing protein [Bacteroidota bacterium]
MVNEKLRTYLEELLSQISIQEIEHQKIYTSVVVIKERLEKYFENDGLKEIRVFGSFDRGTLLSRDIDEESDVDILVVFNEQKWESQTYLNKFKQFAEAYYSRSEIFQDHPTIALKLGHIKFELVPCRYNRTFWGNDEFFIPLKKDGEVEWIETDPDYLKEKISEYEGEANQMLINLILLFKYWNLKIGFQYDSFQVEKYSLKNFYKSYHLEENFLNFIDYLNYSNPKQSQNDANKIAKISHKKIDILLDNDMVDYALLEIKKILPEP